MAPTTEFNRGQLFTALEVLKEYFGPGWDGIDDMIYRLETDLGVRK